MWGRSVKKIENMPHVLKSLFSQWRCQYKVESISKAGYFHGLSSLVSLQSLKENAIFYRHMLEISPHLQILNNSYYENVTEKNLEIQNKYAKDIFLTY